MLKKTREPHYDNNLDYSRKDYYYIKSQFDILRDIINVYLYVIKNKPDRYTDNSRRSCFIGAGLDIVNQDEQSKCEI